MPPLAVDERTGRLAEGTLDLPGGGIVAVKYYPDRISGRVLKQILGLGRLMDAPNTAANAMAIMDACDEAAAFICKIVAEWDLLLTRNPPTPCPLDVDVVADFGLGLMFEILSALVRQVRMGEASGMPSLKRSRPTSSSRSKGSSSRSAVASRKTSSTSR